VAVLRTPLIQLRHVVPTGSARVLLKLESQNPTGSMKDRMALSVVNRAAESRLLPPGPPSDREPRASLNGLADARKRRRGDRRGVISTSEEEKR
jgi:threonine dehydratase